MLIDRWYVYNLSFPSLVTNTTYLFNDVRNLYVLLPFTSFLYHVWFCTRVQPIKHTILLYICMYVCVCINIQYKLKQKQKIWSKSFSFSITEHYHFTRKQMHSSTVGWKYCFHTLLDDLQLSNQHLSWTYGQDRVYSVLQMCRWTAYSIKKV